MGQSGDFDEAQGIFVGPERLATNVEVERARQFQRVRLLEDGNVLQRSWAGQQI